MPLNAFETAHYAEGDDDYRQTEVSSTYAPAPEVSIADTIVAGMQSPDPAVLGENKEVHFNVRLSPAHTTPASMVLLWQDNEGWDGDAPIDVSAALSIDAEGDSVSVSMEIGEYAVAGDWNFWIGFTFDGRDEPLFAADYSVLRIVGSEIEALAEHMLQTLSTINRPFPQSANPANAYAIPRILPDNFAAAPGNNPGINTALTPQQQMDFDTLVRFNNILFAFVVDPDPETRYDPDNFRMVLAMPRHSWVTIEPTGSTHPTHGNIAGVRHMGIMVCESQGFGMLMLPFMAGAEDMLVPDISINRGGTGTGANAFNMNNPVTLGQNLFNNLPGGLQDALRERYGPTTNSVDIQFYFDAMFRTVRQWPSFEINRETGRIPDPRTPEADPAHYRRTYLMSWEISTGIPGIDSPTGWGVANWIDGYRTAADGPVGGGIGGANASFNWFLEFGQPFYDARRINQSHSIATDGNMDIILGLINADAQWGGGGRGGLDTRMQQVAPGQTVPYMYWAQGMLEDFWLTVVDHTQEEHLENGWTGNYHLRVGNWSIHEDAYFNDLGVWMSNATRGSDHMFHHLRVFDEIDTRNDWNKVIEASYEAQRQLALLRYDQERPDWNGNQSAGFPGFGGVNGILPDFAYLNRDAGTWHPAPTTGGGWLEGNSDGTYSWNNVRVPWRFGTDLFMTGRNDVDTLILGNLHRHVNSVWPNFTGIRSMLLDGRGQAPASGTGVGFWSTFTLAAMMNHDAVAISDDPAERQAWANLAWSHARRQAQANNFYADYFKVLSMITASGNYWSAAATPRTPLSHRSLTVRNGYGSGLNPPNDPVQIEARIVPGQMFDRWEIPPGAAFVPGSTARTRITSIVMPNRDIVVSAVYRPADVLSISMRDPGRTRFTVGEPLDTTGMTISVSLETDREGPNLETVVPVTADMVSGFSSAFLGPVILTIIYGGQSATHTVEIARELRPFPQAGADTGRVVELFRPSGVSQQQMNEAVLRQFAQVIVGEPRILDPNDPHPTDAFIGSVRSQFIIDPATFNDPDNLRMVMFIDHGTGGTARTANSRRINVSESQGYGMLMLVKMAGSEDIPFVFEGRNVTVRQLLWEALPAQVQSHFSMEQVDARLFFDAMFRSLRWWPTHPQHVTGGGHNWGAVVTNNQYRGNIPNNFRASHLMAWSIHYNADINGFIRESGPSNATDGCMDMAYALILAGEQWGHAPVWHPTSPTAAPVYSYHEWARRMADDLWLQNVHRSQTNISAAANPPTRAGANYHITSGNWQSGNGAFTTRPSDHMFQHLKAFKAINPERDWQRVIDVTYESLGAVARLQNPVNGIIPDFIRWGHTEHTINYSQADYGPVNSQTIIAGQWNVPGQGTGSTQGYPAPTPGAAGANMANHQWMPHIYRTADSAWQAGMVWHESPSDGARHWNACRVPWRLGVDLLFSGTTPIEEVVTRPYNRFQFEVTNGAFRNVAGRWLNGELNQTHLHARFAHPYYLNSGAAFWGSSAVLAAVYGPQEWFDDAWHVTSTDYFWNNQYGDYINVLTMIATSGNEWTPVGSPVTVINGTLTDSRTSARRIVAGAKVPLFANSVPMQEFSRWEIDGAVVWPGYSLDDANTFIVMPANRSVTATAIYEPVEQEVVEIVLTGTWRTQFTVGHIINLTDLAGMYLDIIYNDGSSRRIPVTLNMIGGFDSAAANPALTVTVSYAGLTATFVVTIAEPRPDTGGGGRRPGGGAPSPRSIPAPTPAADTAAPAPTPTEEQPAAPVHITVTNGQVGLHRGTHSVNITVPLDGFDLADGIYAISIEGIPEGFVLPEYVEVTNGAALLELWDIGDLPAGEFIITITLYGEDGYQAATAIFTLVIEDDHPVVTEPVPASPTIIRLEIDNAAFTSNGVPGTATDGIAPFIDPAHDRTMVPLRTIAEALGAAVSWVAETGTVVIERDGITIQLQVDTELFDAQGISMGRPMIVQDRTFVPLAYVAQMLGAYVRWDGAARAVYISSVLDQL